MSAQPKPTPPTPPAPPAPEGKRNRLGRGLAALIGDAVAEEGLFDQAAAGAEAKQTLPIESIRANAANPRRVFAEEELAGLARSIEEKGLLQPLIVRPVAGAADQWEIVAGERRWRAAQLARLDRVPVIIRALSDAEALEIAIIENVQRTDLNAVEEATGYRRLMDEFGYTQDDLSKVIGKSRSHVANTLRLINLPDKVKEYVADGLLSAGHARALIGAPNAERLAGEVVRQGLSVRQTEALAKAGEEGAGAKSRGQRAERAEAAEEKDPNIVALENDIARALGLKVVLNHRGPGDGPGEVRIAYRTLEQLDEICWRLMAPRPAVPKE
jgi:ParB family chromosome partitioning protein